MYGCSPLSVMTYYDITFGFLDIFLLAVFMLTVFAADSKILIFTVPVLIFAGVMIHEGFIFSYMGRPSEASRQVSTKA